MRRSFTGALLTSCFVHAAALATGAWLLTRVLGGPTPAIEVAVQPSDSVRGIELPTMVGVTGIARDPSVPAIAPELERHDPGRAFSPARPDLTRSGRGGSLRGARSLGLVDEVADVTLDRERFDGRRQSQVGRLATAQRRRSLDNRRATPHPLELSFVATGSGNVRSRQAAGPGAPGRVSGAPEASLAGGHAGESLPEGWTPSTKSGSTPGSVRKAALGSSASGSDPSLRARVTFARPSVPRARAAVPAHQRARPADTLDSEAEVRNTVQSLIQAGGLGVQQHGPGGEPGPDGPGRDGVRPSGARAQPSGTAASGVGFSRDTGLGRYYQELLSQIDWHEAFPTWAIADGRGGVARIGLTVHADGSVSQVSVVRPSGIAEFDRNLVVAIRRDAPYGPLPPAAGGVLRLQISFDALNPVVGREGAGPGSRRR